LITAQELARRESEQIISIVPWSCRTSDLLKLAEILAGCWNARVSSVSVNTAFGMARGTSVIPLLSAFVLKIG